MVYILKNLKKEDNASVQPQSLKSVKMTPGKYNYNVQYTHILFIFLCTRSGNYTTRLTFLCSKLAQLIRFWMLD